MWSFVILILNDSFSYKCLPHKCLDLFLEIYFHDVFGWDTDLKFSSWHLSSPISGALGCFKPREGLCLPSLYFDLYFCVVDERTYVTIENLGIVTLAFSIRQEYLTSATQYAFFTYLSSSCDSLVAFATTQECNMKWI